MAKYSKAVTVVNSKKTLKAEITRSGNLALWEGFKRIGGKKLSTVIAWKNGRNPYSLCDRSNNGKRLIPGVGKHVLVAINEGMIIGNTWSDKDGFITETNMSKIIQIDHERAEIRLELIERLQDTYIPPKDGKFLKAVLVSETKVLLKGGSSYSTKSNPDLIFALTS